MTTKWSHLPNAKHIDRTLVSLKAYPNEWWWAWNETHDATHEVRHSGGWDVAYNAAWDTTVGAERNDARHAAYSSAWGTDSGVAYNAARDVLLALIAYDNSAHMFDSSPEEIQLLIALGHPYAILFLSAAIAFEHIQNLPIV